MLEDDVRVRQLLGFPADRGLVERLRGSEEDVGTVEYGIPLTSAERAEFERRAEVVSVSQQRLEPAARSRADFAGLYIDNQAGGKIVVLTTGDAEQVREELDGIEPRLSDDLVVRRVHITEAQLNHAVRQLSESTERYFGDIPVYVIGADLPRTELLVTVPQERAEAARLHAEKASAAVEGIPIRVEVGESEVEAACTSRDYCDDPMRAGIRIRKGSTSGSICTMGFHITVGSDDQFLTAGHCGYSGSNYWYHKGYGYVGSERATLYRSGGEDIMRVGIVDSQTSRSIHKHSLNL